MKEKENSHNSCHFCSGLHPARSDPSSSLVKKKIHFVPEAEQQMFLSGPDIHPSLDA